MGLTIDDLRDVSRQGIVELHVNWGGYRVSLEFPIDPDKAHYSDHVVMVDMPLPTWGENQNCLK
jgi:hypothetical protein